MADDELKAMVAKLIERIETDRSENLAFRTEVRQMFDKTDHRFEKMVDAINHQSERIARLEGRIEEQSKFLQLALAGRQQRKTAA